MRLSDTIIQKIRKDGPVSFRDFMEMCLYYPGLGYYTSGGDKIGKNGDYYTSPHAGPVFGAMIGRQLEEMWNITGRKDFTIIEYGAGTGMLCRDILEYLQENEIFYSQLRYHIIEKSPAMCERQRALLGEKASWIHSINDIPPFTGCVFSNELVDNFSVHRVVMEDELMEIFVDYNEKGFVEMLQPAGEALVNYLGELNVILPKGFRTEINLEAIEWLREISHRLEKGYILTVDYGYPSSELYRDSRCEGTLLCYHKHTVSDEPYSHIGEQDITSHVNFSALSYWGGKHGLHTCGLTRQGCFLVALGFGDYLKKVLLRRRDTYVNFRQYAFLKYTLLLDMGQKFNVLIQSKGVQHTPLRGLQ